MAVTARTLRIQQQLTDELAKISNTQTRAMVSAWADAFDEVAPDLTAVLLEMLTASDGVTRAQLLRSQRLRRALQIIGDNLATLAADAGVLIIGDLAKVIDAAGGAQASVIDSQLPPGSNLLRGLDTWSRVDERQIAAIVERSTQQITSRLKPLPPETFQVVRRELIRGVAAGSNPRETARRMVRRAEQRFNGQLGLSRAMNIARTETLDAHRAAAKLGQQPDADVLGGWSWLAKLDTLTCPSCWDQHGTVHDITEDGPNDHQQGRCGRLPVTRSWADLGFDIEEPPSLLPDSSTVFDGLSAADQKRILGPARFEAFQAGDYPMGAWSQKVSADGWRDSFRVSPVPKPARKAVA